MNQLEKIDRENIWHPFSPLAGNKPIGVKKAKGVYIHTQDGRKIIDAISSWWVNIHGHSHPKINKAITKKIIEVEIIFGRIRCRRWRRRLALTKWTPLIIEGIRAPRAT